MLLFDVDKLITRIDVDPAQFSWITKQTCQEELGRLSNEQFLDFALLLGSSFLPTFPIFENPSFPGKAVTVRDALPMFNAAGRSALALCANYEDERRVQELQYSDRYKRAYMNIKHHVVMDMEGRVGPMNADNSPTDMHDVLGQRLPEELYFYISKGMLGPEIPNYLTSGQVLISLPLGIEDSQIYRQVAGEILAPLREQAMFLLSNTLHRFYQSKTISVRTWYDENADTTITLRTPPPVIHSVRSWKVPSDRYTEGVKKLQVSLARIAI